VGALREIAEPFVVAAPAGVRVRTRLRMSLFITADREKDKTWGNETIRWNPDQNWLEIRLPTPLARLGNRPSGRFRLSCPVNFTYRGGDVCRAGRDRGRPL